MKSKTHTDLNTQQAKAVNHDDGPALVVAGAGTGKTRVLVARLIRLINEGVEPSSILTLTFTEKAAAEMVDRVTHELGHYELEVPIMTFNAFGESLLRKYSADIGLGRNFNLMGENAQIVFLRERLDDLGLEYYSPVSRPDAMLSDLRDYFSLLKQRVIKPEQQLKFVAGMPSGDVAEKLNKAKYTELAKAFEKYLELCREANVIDYDDQIYLLLDLFSKRPNVLAEVQKQYKYLMVDEFQDTNKMQAELVRLIAGKTANLLVVGDDDQSIYGWRGATLSNILDFKNTYPKTKEITLNENYRSSSQILDTAYTLIQHNNPERLEVKLGINKRLKTEKSGPDPVYQAFENLEEELSWIAKDIKQRMAKGVSAADIAVLSRRNNTIKLLHSYLEYEGVEHVMIGQRYELYQTPLVRMMLECLRCIVDPSENTALYHTLTSPLLNVPINVVGKLATEARHTHNSLWSLLLKSPDKTAQKAVKLIKAWRDIMPTQSIGQLSYEILESSGYKDELYSQAQQDNTVALALNRLSEWFTTLKQFEQIAIVPSAMQYIESLPALQAAGDTGEDDTLDLSNQVVSLLTIHKAKGLEWPVVYIVDCSEGSFPLKNNQRGIKLPEGLDAHSEPADSHISEERRLMYVAMTRAKDELILSRADHHGTATKRKPSRFLSEAFGDAEQASVNANRQTSLFAPIPSLAASELPDITLPGRMLQNGKLKLSVSQLQKYLDCPLDFYYCYVLNVPQAYSPAQAYGSLMHDLLQDINESLIKGQIIDLKSLQEKLETNWKDGGYGSVAQRDRAKQQAINTLKSAYKRIITDKRVPIAVEESFSFNLPDAKLTVIGRFDAVMPNGDGVEIVDYKTSTTVDTPEKAKQRASASQQLAMYALAWQKIHDELPALVSLDFIDTGLVGSVRKTQKGIDSLQEKLVKAADNLRTGTYPPGRDHLFCIHPPL